MQKVIKIIKQKDGRMLINLPKAMAKEIGLDEEDKVEIKNVGKKLVINKLRSLKNE